MPTKTRYAGYPSTVVYKGPAKKGAVQQLLWGDWMKLTGEEKGNFVEVHARGEDGWVHKDEIQESRLLEVVFVDIGQGDGCLVVTPQDKHMVIDAGEEDNMFRFLRWRYGGFKKKFKFECGVISHPDADHYGGFDDLFKEPNAHFDCIYQNGVMERSGKDSLGPKAGSPRHLTELITNRDELDAFLGSSKWTTPNRKNYPKMLKKGADNDSFDKFEMAHVDYNDGYLPGYEKKKDLSIRILGPVPQFTSAGRPRLKWLSSVGKTKNGHSVVLRLQYRDVSILLGGDLNIPSENLLLSHHTGLSSPPKSVADAEKLIAAARPVFQVEIAKSCHHGSADFSPIFLDATNPLVTVISSGDDESHSHPRADALGSIGAHSRGHRPLIFNTELARSTKEAIKNPHLLKRELLSLSAQIDAESNATKKGRLQKKLEKLVAKIDRSVAVYGAINVRTDGKKVIMAQKLESPRSKSSKWDIYRLEPEGNQGPLHYVSKH